MAIFDVPLDELRKRGTIKWRRFEADVLPMFVAEMDAHVAAPVRERLERALLEGDTGYPQLPTYQESFADYARWQWGYEVAVEEVRLVADVVTGMREAVTALTEPGDAVVINPPIYPPFRGVSAGRRIVEVHMRAGRLDLGALEDAFAEHKPKAYLLCSPHNPTGAIHTADELAEIARLAERHGVVVVSNEIHAPLAGAKHTPYLQAAKGARGLIITSASKSWNLAALKAAVITGHRELLDQLHPMIGDSASYFGILSHGTAMKHARDWLASVADEIAENKRFFAEELQRRIPELSYTPSEGTYLGWLDCSPLGLAHPAKHFHDVGRVRFNFGTEFDRRATQFVRINLATSRDIIAEGINRMATSL